MLLLFVVVVVVVVVHLNFNLFINSFRRYSEVMPINMLYTLINVTYFLASLRRRTERRISCIDHGTGEIKADFMWTGLIRREYERKSRL